MVYSKKTKKTYKRRPRKVAVKKTYKKRATNLMTFGSAVKSVFPAIFKTRLRNAIAVVNIPATPIPGTGTYFDFYANKLEQPFNTAADMTSTIPCTVKGPYSIIGQYSDANIFDSIYTDYRIDRIHAKITVSADDIYESLILTGWCGDQLPVAINGYYLQRQPGAKQQVVVSQGGGSKTFYMTWDIRSALGMSKTQYYSQPTTELAMDPANLVSCFFAIEPMDGQATTAYVNILIDIMCDITFYNLIPQV